VTRRLAIACAVTLLVGGATFDRAHAQRGETAIRYRVSFPEPQHHWMQVEATFPSI